MVHLTLETKRSQVTQAKLLLLRLSSRRAVISCATFVRHWPSTSKFCSVHFWDRIHLPTAILINLARLLFPGIPLADRVGSWPALTQIVTDRCLSLSSSSCPHPHPPRDKHYWAVLYLNKCFFLKLTERSLYLVRVSHCRCMFFVFPKIICQEKMAGNDIR